MQLEAPLHLGAAGGTALVPVIYALAAAWPSSSKPLARASRATAAATVLAVLVACVGLVTPAQPGPFTQALAGWLRIDVFSLCMLVLVSILGWVVARFSQTCLHGEPGQGRYARSLLVVLAAVATLVTSDSLIVIGSAWLATSLALHQLLVFYPNRPQAQLAARRKFIWCRIADTALATAVYLFYLSMGTTSISGLEAWTANAAALPLAAQAGCVLIVLAAALRTAQLPFHGWLLQVMEAPTPVSALLHAGVINIAGFLLVRLAPLMALAPVAQTLLAIIGTATAVLAGIAATTRPNVKESLAWSTSAQMGFMLVQCAMGWWHLAFIHLLAHSIYKAYAFLSAGSQVDNWLLQGGDALVVHAAATRQTPWLARSIYLAYLGFGLFLLTRATGHFASDTLPSFVLLAGVGMTLHTGTARATSLGDGFFWRSAALVVASFSALHLLARTCFSVPVTFSPSLLSWISVAVGFALLLAYQVLTQVSAGRTLSMRIWIAASSGYYLDAIAARFLHRLVPMQRLNSRTPQHELVSVKSPFRTIEQGIQ